MTIVIDAAAFKILARKTLIKKGDLRTLCQELRNRFGGRLLVIPRPTDFLKRMKYCYHPIASTRYEDFKNDKLYDQLLRALEQFLKSPHHYGAKEDAEWLAQAITYHVRYHTSRELVVITHGEHEYRRFSSAKNLIEDIVDQLLGKELENCWYKVIHIDQLNQGNHQQTSNNAKSPGP